MGYQIQKAYQEWKYLRSFVKIFCNNYKEYSNILLLVEIILVISGSNSSVERSFSMLTLVLSDRRLGLSHRNMENVLTLRGNDKNWSERERNKIIEAVVAS